MARRKFFIIIAPMMRMRAISPTTQYQLLDRSRYSYSSVSHSMTITELYYSFSISFKSLSGRYKIRRPTIIPPRAVQKWLWLKNLMSIASSTYQIPRQIKTSPTTMEKFLTKYESVKFLSFFIIFIPIINGGGEIRTHGGFPHAAFQVRYDRPLCHPSKISMNQSCQSSALMRPRALLVW